MKRKTLSDRRQYDFGQQSSLTRGNFVVFATTSNVRKTRFTWSNPTVTAKTPHYNTFQLSPITNYYNQHCLKIPLRSMNMIQSGRINVC